jgi:hypothetical protein
MAKVVADLPDDLDALKAIIGATSDQRALLETRNDHLEAVNKTADERIAMLTAIVECWSDRAMVYSLETFARRQSARSSMPSCSTKRDRYGSGPKPSSKVHSGQTETCVASAGRA